MSITDANVGQEPRQESTPLDCSCCIRRGSLNLLAVFLMVSGDRRKRICVKVPSREQRGVRPPEGDYKACPRAGWRGSLRDLSHSQLQKPLVGAGRGGRVSAGFLKPTPELRTVWGDALLASVRFITGQACDRVAEFPPCD